MLILHLEGQPFSILGFTIPESKHSVLCDDKKCKMALRFFTFVTTKARQEWRPKTLLLLPFFLGQDSWDERLVEVSLRSLTASVGLAATLSARMCIPQAVY